MLLTFEEMLRLPPQQLRAYCLSNGFETTQNLKPTKGRLMNIVSEFKNRFRPVDVAQN